MTGITHPHRTVWIILGCPRWEGVWGPAREQGPCAHVRVPVVGDSQASLAAEACSTTEDGDEPLHCPTGYECHIINPGNTAEGIPNRGQCIKLRGNPGQWAATPRPLFVHAGACRAEAEGKGQGHQDTLCQWHCVSRAGADLHVLSLRSTRIRNISMLVHPSIRNLSFKFQFCLLTLLSASKTLLPLFC